MSRVKRSDGFRVSGQLRQGRITVELQHKRTGETLDFARQVAAAILADRTPPRRLARNDLEVLIEAAVIVWGEIRRRRRPTFAGRARAR